MAPKTALYIGPMFADKTQTIIRTANRYQDTGKNCLIITYTKDIRPVTTYSGVSSHSSMFRGLNDQIKVVRVNRLSEIFEPGFGLSLAGFFFIAIEECHFFDDLLDVFFKLRRMQTLKDLIVVGLDADRDQKGYSETTLSLVPHVQKVKKMPAICRTCGEDAIYTRCRMADKSSERELIGGADLYYAICWSCAEIFDSINSPHNSRPVSPASEA